MKMSQKGDIARKFEIHYRILCRILKWYPWPMFFHDIEKYLFFPAAPSVSRGSCCLEETTVVPTIWCPSPRMPRTGATRWWRSSTPVPRRPSVASPALTWMRTGLRRSSSQFTIETESKCSHLNHSSFTFILLLQANFQQLQIYNNCYCLYYVNFI